MALGGEDRRQQHRIGMATSSAARSEWALAVISHPGFFARQCAA